MTPQTTKPTRSTLKKITVNFLLPISVFLIILSTFFKNITFYDIKENFLKIPVSYLIAFILLTLVGTVLRTWKYRILLSNKLRFSDVFLITLVRNFSVDLLPGRAAALVLYSWLAKRKGIKLEEGASSFVVSVFYDALGLAFMLGILLFFLETSVPWIIYAAMGFILAVSVVMIFFADHLIRFGLTLNLLNRVPKLKQIADNILEYLEQHKSNRERLNLFLLSLGTRVVKYVFIYILFEGVLNLGVSLHNFALFSFGLAGTELSSLIPIQGPGGFGTWELAFTVIFKALGIPAQNIEEAGFVIHIVTQVWEYSIGLMALGYLFSRGNSSNREPQRPN